MSILGLSCLLALWCVSPTTDGRCGDRKFDRAADFAVAPYLRSKESGATCGIYSLWLAIQVLGNDVPLETLLSGEFVNLNSGSSAADLQAAADQCGVSVQSVSGMALSELRCASGPVLLQFRYGRDLAQLNHWVVYLGDSGGKALICDLPRRPAEMDYADLMAMWSGTALVVQNGQSTRSFAFIVSRLWVVNRLWFPIVLGVGAFCICNVRRKLFAPDEVLSHVVAGGTIVIMALLWSVVSGWANPLSIWRNPTTIRLIACKSIGLASIEFYDRPLTNKITIVDCRLPMDFAAGHIDAAVSLPIDSTISELRAFLESVDAERPLLVYCQSDQCSWAATMAARLRCAGNSSVHVLQGGFAKWRETEIR